MSERYLYNQTGIVEEMVSYTKAVLGFSIKGEPMRVLLWVKNFQHKDNLLTYNDSLHGKLREGDAVTFHCHPYDKTDNMDNCTWFAAHAWRSKDNDHQLTVLNQRGQVVELETGKGVLQFSFFDKEETVYFIRSKYFYFGQRMSSKKDLTQYLFLDDKVFFDATRCQPTAENMKSRWFARAVWKGKKPDAATATQHSASSAGCAEDGAGEEEDDEGNEAVAAPAAAVVSKTQEPRGLYDRFEDDSPPRNAPGNVVSLLTEEAGVALWMTAANHWETVFFHRSTAYIDNVSLSKYNLQEALPKDTRVMVTAVRAVQGFPCKWLARKVVATSAGSQVATSAGS